MKKILPLILFLLLPSVCLAAVSSDSSEKSGWGKVSPNVASKIQENLRKAMCRFEIANGGASASTMDGQLTLRADAKATRFKSGDNWFSLSLDSVGRMGKMQKTDKPVLSSDGAKLSLKREALTEWYINQGNNLEHGLVLNEKPAGVGNLKFYFTTSGNLTPKQDGNDITFIGKETMNYAGIKAWDASGRDLVCSMSVDGGKLVWSVDDSGAVYPVTVDPTVSIAKKITARTDADADDTEASAYLGISVSLSGDLAIVGAYGKEESGKSVAGAAYVFSKDQGGANNWGIVKKLTARTDADADDTEVGASFGYSVSLSGDLAIVGAYTKEESGKNWAGASYVFSKDQGGPNNWGIVKKLTARTDANTDDTDEKAYFGVSVSLSGDLAIVGAYAKEESGKLRAGASYVFSKDQGGANNWGIVKKLTARTDADADDTEAGALFGNSVSLSGDLAIVGAYDKEESGKSIAGASYVFSKDQGGANNWGIVKKLTARTDADADDTEAGALFGNSVSLSGDLAIVGASEKNEPGKSNAGAAYVFSKDQGGPNNWGIVKKLTARTDADADDTEASASFGISVSLSGDLAIVGAYTKEESGKSIAGASYVFSKDQGGANNWGIVKKLTARTDADADDTEAGALFGNSVSLSGDLAIVGAYTKEESGKSAAGAAYIYSTASPTDIDKIVVPAPSQPSGTVVTIDSNDKQVKTTAEVKTAYRNVSMDSMLGSQTYEFTATVTSGKVAYFCFNSSSLGERRAGDVSLFKLFTNKDSKKFTYSADKVPADEGYFWITDEANSGQYMDPNSILTGGQVYTVNYSVKDNGEYDANDILGQITDPVVPGLSSSGGDSGCVLNPNAGFSIEWLFMGLVAVVLMFRMRFMKRY